MRCPRCGNENPGNNRFCGMCGATLLSSSPPVPVHPAPQAVSAAAPPANPAPAPESQPAPEPVRVATRVEQPASISGPSFLGLNDPVPPRKRGSLSIDPHSSTSSNLDYLLEDVEEPQGGGGAGKVFLILLALLLAVGFGYLRFRTHGFPWASLGASKPAPSAQTPDVTGASATPASSPSITPEPQPATSTATQPAAPIQPASAPVTNAQDTTAQPPTQPAQVAPSSPSSGSTSTNPPAANPASAKPSDTAPPAADASQPADNGPSSGNAGTAPDKDSSATSAPVADAPAPKPPAATKPIDTVAEAQRYIYGKGASQDCDRGLRLLKPSANQGNPKAMVEMGALYSAGLCTPRDLPTAYRWFALALRKDPSNDSIQSDLQKLWGEMTQPERQLAIRLTQ